MSSYSPSGLQAVACTLGPAAALALPLNPNLEEAAGVEAGAAGVHSQMSSIAPVVLYREILASGVAESVLEAAEIKTARSRVGQHAAAVSFEVVGSTRCDLVCSLCSCRDMARQGEEGKSKFLNCPQLAARRVLPKSQAYYCQGKRVS